jgi:type I restriction enzyme M protein
VEASFAAWAKESRVVMAALDSEVRPKAFVGELAEKLLDAYRATELVDEYAIYQGLMEFWADTMQDDTYLIVDGGWAGAATPVKLAAKSKDRADFTVGKDKFKSELIPAPLLIARFFPTEQAAVDEAEAALAVVTQQLDEQHDEHGGDEGLLSDLFVDRTRISKRAVADRLKASDLEADEEALLMAYQEILEDEAAVRTKVNAAKTALEAKVAAKYGELSVEEIQALVIDDKWLAAVSSVVQSELNRLAHVLAQRLQQLETRYATPLPTLVARTDELATRVGEHLRQMGAEWR